MLLMMSMDAQTCHPHICLRMIIARSFRRSKIYMLSLATVVTRGSRPAVVKLYNFYCKTRFFACPLFCEFREPGKFAKITARENLNSSVSV